MNAINYGETAVLVSFCLILFHTSVSGNFSNALGSAFLALFAAGLVTFSWVTWGQVTVWSPPASFDVGVFSLIFKMDDLGRVFAFLLSILLLSVSLYSSSYLDRWHSSMHHGRYWICVYVLVGGMVGVTFSANAISFMVFWELMSLSAAALIATDYESKSVHKSALIYLSTSRIATAFMAAGFLLMFTLTRSWNFQSWNFSSSATVPSAALILLGLCIKSGMWPFHLWLPYTYASAPTPVSALMSGYMSKLAILTMVRLFIGGHLQDEFLLATLFALSILTGLWGITFSLVQTELKRMLAYSSVENMGLILLCIASSLIASNGGNSTASAMALVAGLLHCLNHGLFKSLLFLCVGSVEVSTRTCKLNNLGGLAKRMPVTFVCAFIGGFAAASTPPLNGFFGKWLLYRSLLTYLCSTSHFFEKGVCLLAICALSSIGALALFTFSKFLAVPWLGLSRTHSAKTAIESSKLMVSGQLLLTFACITTGLFANKLVLLLQTCSAGLVQDANLTSFNLPIAPVFSLVASLFLMTYFGLLRGAKPVYSSTWDCGFGQQSLTSQVTAESFAQPAARILRPLFRYKNSSKLDGSDWRHFPEKIEVETSVVSILETRVYAPTVRVVRASSKVIAKLQGGSIHLYLFYVCSTLTLLLILGAVL